MSYSQLDRMSRAPQSWSPQAPGRRPSRRLQLLGVALGYVGLIAGVVACSRPATTTEADKPAYSDQQVADAKKAVCDIFEAGQKSIRAAGNRKPDNPADPFPVTAINVRLAEVAISNSLFHAVSSNPATPADLAGLVEQLAKQYQDIALIQLADGQLADFSSIAKQSDDTISQIRTKCR